MKEAKKMQVTDQICKQVQLMRRGGANQTEIGKLLGINPCTVSRIESAGFSYEQYLENRRIAKEKEKKAKEQAEEPQAQEEQVPGQIEMELVEAKEPEEHDETLGDMQTKMMRFQAEMTTKMIKAIEAAEVQICMKLDRLNDTMCMLLRAIRKE